MKRGTRRIDREWNKKGDQKKTLKEKRKCVKYCNLVHTAN